MNEKYYKIVGRSTKRLRLDDYDRWKIARPFLTEMVLMITDYIFKKDEMFKIYDERKGKDDRDA